MRRRFLFLSRASFRIRLLGVLCHRTSVLMALLSRRFNDLPYPYQIVDGAGEGEHPPSTLETLVSGLPHQPNGLRPSKNLLDRFAFPLADPISRMACGALINRTSTPTIGILSSMKGDVHSSHLVKKLRGVIVLVGAKCQSALSFSFHFLHHLCRCCSFRLSRGLGVGCGDDQSTGKAEQIGRAHV